MRHYIFLKAVLVCCGIYEHTKSVSLNIFIVTTTGIQLLTFC